MQETDVFDLEARRKADAPHVLLDVRDDDELAVASISGAHHIRMNDVPARIEELSADVPIIVMCHHGGRSEKVTKYLNANGRPNAMNLRGGIDAWSAQIDKTVRRY